MLKISNVSQVLDNFQAFDFAHIHLRSWIALQEH